MNFFELIIVECYEDNLIMWSFILYVNDYICYLYVVFFYMENNLWLMLLYDI